MLAQLILGHVVGDYFFQTRSIATLKGENSLHGWIWCSIHCIIYTIMVCLAIENFQPLTMLIVFNSHFWIDKFSLAKYWIMILNGKDYLKKFSKISTDNTLELIFGSVVYIIIDNTLHLLIMWIGLRYI